MASDVNFVAVVVAALANMVVGAVWYNVLAEPWVRLTGKTGMTRQDMQQGSGPGYAIALVGSLLMAYVLERVILIWQVANVWGGLAVAVGMWVGFVATATAANYAFEGRPLKLWAINYGYPLFGLAVMGIILSLWQ